MKKEILSEIAIYSGEVKPPEGFEINRESLALDVLTFQAKDSKNFPFSKIPDFFRHDEKKMIGIFLIEGLDS